MLCRNSVALLAFCSLAACVEGTPAAPKPPAIVGTYTLNSLNGTAIPMFYAGSARSGVEISDGRAIVSPSGRIDLVTIMRERWDGQTAQELAQRTFKDSVWAAYVQHGDSIVMTFSTGTQYRGTVRGDTLSLNTRFGAQVFRR